MYACLNTQKRNFKPPIHWISGIVKLSYRLQRNGNKIMFKWIVYFAFANRKYCAAAFNLC